MSDQSKLGLGQIITTEQNRDAIHVAVAPVVAGEPIMPGEHIDLLPNGEAVTSNGVDATIGVADPFLRKQIKTGDRFWIFLYPGSITSLRHEWSHPKFETAQKQKDVSVSESWIKAFCAGVDVCYDDMIEAARASLSHGMYELNTAFEIPVEFWDHYEVIFGVKVPANDRQTYFSCSC